MKKQPLSLLTLLLALLLSCSQESNTRQDQTAEAPQLMDKAKTYFAVLPEAANFANNPKAQLGKKLFYETALSINGEMNCNSCHGLASFGVDNEPTSPGHEGKRGDRNSPTVYNAWFHIAQFWDGRAADLSEQAKGPILNPVEMGIPDEATAVRNIEEIAEYKALFEAAFPDKDTLISYQNIADAIAEFEKTLRTPAPIDDYLEGDKTALTEAQLKGMQVFIEKGCTSCHSGAGFGGHLYQKFGLINAPYWEYTGSAHQDQGRFAVTGQENDKQVFKVSSLRNIAKTAPYFHDGSVRELDEAVRIMGKTQLGTDLTEEEVESIVVFLDALTGKIPAHALQDEGNMALE